MGVRSIEQYKFSFVKDLTDPNSEVTEFGTLTTRGDQFESWEQTGTVEADELISTIVASFEGILRTQISEGWPYRREVEPDLPLSHYLIRTFERSSFPIRSRWPWVNNSRS